MQEYRNRGHKALDIWNQVAARSVLRFQTLCSILHPPSSIFPLLLALLASVAAMPVLAQPTNDNFSNARVIAGSVGSTSGSTVGATLEPNEPSHDPFSFGGHSVWFRWTAPNSGLATFDTLGSSFDTVLAAYSGTSLGNLVQLASDDDIFSPFFALQSRIVFSANAGTDYYIAIDGWDGAFGNYVLSWNSPTNAPPPPTPATNQFQFSSTAYRVNENTPGFILITVVYSGGAANPVTVDYATADGTALAGPDYIASNGTLSFDVGETNKTFTVQILDNANLTGDKTFTVNLSNPTGGATIGISNAVVTIVDDENSPIVSTAGQFEFSAVNYRVTENESFPAPFGNVGAAVNLRNIRGVLVTVNRKQGRTGRVLVDYSTSDGTALAGIDYLPVTNTLIFDDFQTSTNFVVPIVQGGFFGTNSFTNFFNSKFFNVLLFNPRPAPEEELNNPGFIVPTLGLVTNATASIVAINNLPLFDIERANYRADEFTWFGGSIFGSGTVTIEVIYPPGGPVSVGIRTPPASSVPHYLWGTPPFWSPMMAGSDYADDTTTIFPNPVYTDGSSNILNEADYVPVDTILNFGQGQTRALLTLTINNNSAVEFNEDILVEIYRLNGQPGVGPQNFSTATILCNDQPSGALDREWNPDLIASTSPPFNYTPGANNVVNAVAVQADLKTILGGDFTAYNSTPRNRVARLHVNGALDATFNPGTGADGFVSAVAVYPTYTTNAANLDKILIGGGFTSYNGEQRNGIARLNSDGSLDATFQPGVGADGPVRSLAVQNDGKILIAGEFTQFNGIDRNGVVRLNEDGSLDLNFDPGAGADGTVWSVVVRDTPQTIFSPRQASGTELQDNNAIETGANQGVITVSYDFLQVPDDIRIYYDGVRLFDLFTNGIGQINIPYGPGTGTVVTVIMNEGNGIPGTLWSYTASILPVAKDRKIFIGGDFINFDGTYRGGVARLTDHGSLDTDFDPGGGADNSVRSVAIQADGRLLIAGAFNIIDFHLRNSIARLNSDGKLDVTYDPGDGANNTIFSVSLQPDGKALIGGVFTSYNQTRRLGLARLLANGLLDTSFLDTAYNQFAGLINPFYFQPPNFVNAVVTYASFNTNITVTQVVTNNTTNIFINTTLTRQDYVLIGGSFTNLGGNFSIDINGNNSRPTPVWTRQDKRARYNVARLIGGSTPGPGNVEFAFPAYSIDNNNPLLSVTLQRLDGRLGTVKADLATSNLVAEANADFSFTKSTKVWPEWAYVAPRSVGYVGFTYFAIPIMNDTLLEGNEIFNLGLFNPEGEITLGGEFIPLGGARGHSFAPVTVVDDNVNRGVFTFSAAGYATNENATNLIVTVIRTNGNNGPVTVDYFTRDGTAQAGLRYIAKSGTLSFGTGVTNQTILIKLINDNIVEFDETFLVVLTNATGGAKIPGGTAGSTISTTATIIDDDFSAGRLNFSAPSYSTNEGAGIARIVVTRTGGNRGAISVKVAATNGTALAGVNFVAVTNTLVWASGETTPKIFNVPLIDDNLVEGLLTVNLRLFNASTNGAIGGRATAILNIQDNDAYGTVAFSQANYEGNENGTNVNITVVRSGGIAGSGSVDYLILDGTAVNGVNYSATNGTLTFLPGETSKTIAVGLIDNSLSQGNQTVILVLTNAVNVSLGTPGQSTLTIIDDESSNTPAGSLDTTFNTINGADDAIFALALQTDGELIIGGDFIAFNHATRHRLARLQANGALDSVFNAGEGPNRPVRALALQSDGKIIVGGLFTKINSTNRSAIARLNPDGTLDGSFNPGAGADNPVFAVALLPDNKVLIGGSFTTFNGVPRPNLALLNTNGSLNTFFNPGLGPNGIVYALAVQPDGKVLLGGDFLTVSNVSRPRIARLNSDGSLDLTFYPGAGINASVRTIALQPDGKILIGGSFTMVNGTNRNYFARLNADGSLDAGFMPGGSGADNTVFAAAVQEDGKILVGGDFATFNGVYRSRITRLNQNGQTDPTINFGSGANSFIAAVLIQPDRKIVIGGGFTTFNDQPEHHVARLYGGSLAGAGNLEFSSPFFTVDEPAGAAQITVRRNGGTSGDVTIDYATTGITATAGLDFSNTVGTLSFPEGEVRRTFIVPIIDDTLVEDPETVDLSLSNPTSGAALGPQPTATLTIVSDDSVISFLTPTFSVSENVIGSNAFITVVKTGSTNSSVSVDYQTLDGTATAGVDYLPVRATLTFAPGESFKNFQVPILIDPSVEGNKTVMLSLTNVTRGGSLSLAAATLTIVENDFAGGEFDFSSPVYTVNEYDTNITITVTRTNGISGIVSVSYSTIDGTATAGQDYTGAFGILSFSDGETSKSFNIPITPDHLQETNETVILTLTAPSGGATLGIINTATLTIIDNNLINGNLNFSATNYTVNESNLIATITVTRTLGSEGDVSVQYLTRDGTASAGTNYQPAFGSLSWTNGETTPKTFTVSLVNDTLVEGTTVLSLVLTNPTGGATLGPRPIATLTILDDDTGPGFLGFSSANYVVSEDATNAVITVTRNFGSTGTVSITYFTTDGTALNGVNYLGTTNVLSFGPGETNKVFTVPLIDNASIDVNKTLNLGLSNPIGASTNNQIVSALLTIVENSAPAGSIDASFNTLGANDQIYSVVIQTNNNKIFAGGDFTLFNNLVRKHIVRLLPNGGVDTTFDPTTNVNSTVQTIAVKTGGEPLIGGLFTAFGGGPLSYLAGLLVDGSAGSNFLRGVSGADNSVYALAFQSDGKVIVGGLFNSVNGSNSYFIARLDAIGQVDATFHANPGPDGGVRAIVVQNNGKILIAGDFQTINGIPRSRIARLNEDGSVDTTFDPGAGADSTVNSIALQNDGRAVIGGLFTQFNGIAVGRVARLNQDGAFDSSFNPGSGANEFVSVVALQTDGKILVGGGFTSFNGAPRNRITRLNTDGSIDTTINFGNGANNYISAIAIQQDRKIVIGGAFTAFDGAPRNYIARLNGGENVGSGSFVFSSPNYTVPENGTKISITVLRAIGSSNVVSVDFSTSDGTAIAGTHYAQTNGTLTFQPGETLKTFTVTVFDDSATNVDRTVHLTLSNPKNLSNPFQNPPIVGTPGVATLSILDNDSVLGFAVSSYSVSENAGNAIIAVQRLGGSLGTATVNYATSDGTAINGIKYISVNGTLIFTNGQTLRTFSVPIINETNVEGNQTVNLTLSQPAGTAVLGLAAATLTIVDDDFSPGSLGFTSPNFTVSEQGASALITVSRAPGSSGSASVQFTTSDLTAQAGLDYGSTNGILVFASGEITKSFSVPIFDDFVLEGPQTVLLTLSNPTGAILGPGQAAAILNILEDTSFFNFSSAFYSASESATNVIITVVRSGGGGRPVSVDFTTSNLTAIAGVNYVATNGTLLFTAGQSSASFAVPLINDNIGQPDTSLLLILSNPVGEAALGATNQATLTIIDDDVSFNFSAPAYSVSEKAGAIVIPVLRTGITNGVVSVNYATSDGTAQAGIKYVFTSGTLVFADGQTSNSFSVPIIDENMGEGNQTVNLSLLNPTNGTSLGLQSTAVLTIIDDEDTLSFSATNYFVLENQTNVIITVIRGGQPGTNVVTVAYSATNGTAVAGTNYTPVTGRLFFSVFDTVQFFSIPILNDPRAQGDKVVSLNLFDVTGGATLIAPTNATLTILDKDASLSFSSPAYTVSEGGTNAIITVNRIGNTINTFSVGYASSDGTARAGVNYRPVSGVLIFPPGVSSQTILVPLIDDLVIEGNVTVNLALFNPSPTNFVTLGAPNTAVLTIVDNDSSTIVAAGSAFIFESIPNGNLDPNEDVTINFGLRNIGNIDTINLRATLLASGGVSNPSGPQFFGAVLGGGATVSRPFSFKALGANGGTVVVSLQLRDVGKGLDLGVVTFNFTLGRSRFTFVNNAAITINDFAPATPYPSSIVVSNVPGILTNVTMSLYNLSHTYPPDIDMLLSGPQSKSVIVMSDVGGFNNPISSVNLTFDDAAASRLTATDVIVSGTYQPSPVGPDSFNPPAPAPPYVRRLADLANGASPNGVWSLFVVDDQAQDVGFIAGGWSLTLETTSSGAAAADLSVSIVSTPNPTIVNQILRYTVAVTNNGPATATGVFLTNVLPASITFISCSGNCAVNGQVVTCNVGTLASGAGTAAIISVRTTASGSILDTATVTGDQLDLNPNNNFASMKTTVLPLPSLVVARKDNKLVMSWPAAVTNYNFQIEATDTFSPPNWVPVTDFQSLNGSQLNLTIDPTNRARFYRLREP